jgi:hypothetical protein
LAAVWQDVRISRFAGDGIAFSQSLDGGLTWSAFVGINADPTVAAFEPTIHYRSDGIVGVTYFDFHAGPATMNSLPTDYWVTLSGNGAVWNFRQITGPFDLSIAPNAEGLFVGDYQGLASVGEAFVPFYVQTNNGDLANRTDVFTNLTQPILPIEALVQPVRAARVEGMHQARPSAVLELTPDLTQALRDSATRAIQRRMINTGP